MQGLMSNIPGRCHTSGTSGTEYLSITAQHLEAILLRASSCMHMHATSCQQCCAYTIDRLISPRTCCKVPLAFPALTCQLCVVCVCRHRAAPHA